MITLYKLLLLKIKQFLKKIPIETYTLYVHSGHADVEVVMKDVPGTYVLLTSIPFKLDYKNVTHIDEVKSHAIMQIHELFIHSRCFIQIKEKTSSNVVHVNKNDIHKYYIKPKIESSTVKQINVYR